MDGTTLRLVAMLLVATTSSSLHAQTASGTRSSGGFTKAINANAVRAGVSRDGVRTADDRGRAADAIGSTSPAPVNMPQGQTRAAGPLVPIAVAQGEPSLGRISKGAAALPNDAGQVWREYDLTPYTSKLKDWKKPEQAVIDWILRDTGTEVWFSAPVGMLSADRNVLRVYHTPEMQEVVKGVYDRFMTSSAQPTRMSVRVVSVANPNWRSRVQPLLKPIQVKSTGVEAWLVSREHAVMLMKELSGRADFREVGAQIVDIPNGQSQPIGLTKPRSYVKSLRNRGDVLAGFEPEMGVIDEGFALTLSPLGSVDGRSIDLTAKCHIDQVERLIPVPIDVVAAGGIAQRSEIQVPQLVSWRLHERFRWPVEQVLVMSCGVVASPKAETASSVPFLSALTGNNRADALLFVAVEGPGAALTVPNPPAGPLAGTLPKTTLPTTSSLPAPQPATGPASFLAQPLPQPTLRNEPFRR